MPLAVSSVWIGTVSDRGKNAPAPAAVRAERIIMMLLGCAAIAFMSGAILHCSAAELAGVAVAVAVIGGKIAAIPMLVCAVLRATA